MAQNVIPVTPWGQWARVNFLLQAMNALLDTGFNSALLTVHGNIPTV